MIGHSIDISAGNTEDFTVLVGCSNNNQNFPVWTNGEQHSFWEFGLNLDPISLSSQLLVFIDGIFSYCVVPYDQYFPFDVHSHLLRFGNDVHLPQGNIPTTHYVTVEVVIYITLMSPISAWEIFAFNYLQVPSALHTACLHHRLGSSIYKTYGEFWRRG